MKIIIAVFLFLNMMRAQTTVTVIDSETKKPIPFATLFFQKANSYRNAEYDGTIEISKDENISEIQSFGYENLKVTGSSSIYALKPIYQNIENVEIYKPKNLINIKAGKIRKELPNLSLWSQGNYIYLKFFPFESTYPKTTFIKTLKFLSEVQSKKSATIQLVFYKNTDGKPSDKIHENITVICEKGKNITEVNLENKNIIFPKNGIFIGFDWIINDENQFEETLNFTDESGENSKKNIARVNPFIFTQKDSKPEIFFLDKLSNDFFPKDFSGFKNRTLTLELLLSN